jgi:molybdopterin synthase sulfur carrier subunit
LLTGGGAPKLLPMPTVFVTPNLTRHVPCPTTAVKGATVRAALDDLFARVPRLRGYVLDDQGALRQHVNVFVNDESVRDRTGLGDTLGPNDEIFIFQALSGG